MRLGAEHESAIAAGEAPEGRTSDRVRWGRRVQKLLELYKESASPLFATSLK